VRQDAREPAHDKNVKLELRLPKNFVLNEQLLSRLKAYQARFTEVSLALSGRPAHTK